MVIMIMQVKIIVMELAKMTTNTPFTNNISLANTIVIVIFRMDIYSERIR